MIRVTVREQGCIKANSVTVLADQPGLVVLAIDTTQKRVDCGADMASPTRGVISLYADEQTLHVKPEDNGVGTYIEVHGLPRSKSWHVTAIRGRYTSTVVFYRVNARNKAKRLHLEEP